VATIAMLFLRTNGQILCIR